MHPGQRRHHQHPAGHARELVECERVEFLAGAGPLADPVPLHPAQPLQLLDVPASAQPNHQHPAGHVGDLVECLTSAGTASAMPGHARERVEYLPTPTP